jgi:hypothetical protein
MPLITTTVPNLIGGVSQQPDSRRLLNQCEEQENAMPMVVGGLIKRPPTNHVGQIRQPYGDAGGSNSVDLSNSFTHIVTRDTEDEFLISLDGSGTVNVHDINPTSGTPVSRTVHYDVGTIGEDHYLRSDNPQKDFRAVSIADVTFIVNTSKTVAMSSTKSPYSLGTTSPQYESLIWIKTGGYGVEFTIKSGSTTFASFNGTTDTSEDPPSTTVIATSLAGGSFSGIDTHESKGSVVYVNDSSSYELTVEDSLGQSGHALCTSSDDESSGVAVARNFSDIPEIAKKDMIIKVDGNPEEDIDDYYVKFVPNVDGTALRRGIWQETLAPNIDQEYDYSTMPHILIRQSDGTFVIKRANGSASAGTSTDTKAFYDFEFVNRPTFYKTAYPFTDEQYQSSAQVTLKGLKSDGSFDTKTYVFTRYDNNSGELNHADHNGTEDDGLVRVVPPDLTSVSSCTVAFKEAIDAAQSSVFDTTLVTTTAGSSKFTVTQKHSGSAGNTEIIYTNGFASSSYHGWVLHAFYDYNFGYLADPGFNPAVHPQGSGQYNAYYRFDPESIGTGVSAYWEEALENDHTALDPNTPYADFGVASWNTQVSGYSGVKLKADILAPGATNNFSGGTEAVDPAGYLPAGAASDIYDNFKFTPRSAGNDTTNPLPSFVGTKINDISFFKNRLVLLAGENVVLSEVGEYFNFFRTTTTQLIDSDVIDVGVGGTEVNELFTATPFSDRLILFSTKTQFSLQGEAILSPSTASISQVTTFDINTDVHPITVGALLFFTFNRGSFAGMRQFFRTGSSDVEYDAAETTVQIPSYIKGPVRKITASSHEDVVAVLGTGTNDIYLYKYYKENENLIQSAWCKFVVAGENQKVVDIQFIRQSLHVLIVREGRTYIERIDLQSGITDEGSTYVTCLDRRTKITADASGTTLTLDSSCILSEQDEIQVVSSDGETMTIDSVTYNNGSSADTIKLKESFNSGDVFYVGLPYTMRYEASMPILKRSKPNGGLEVVATGRHQIRYMTVVYSDTAHFKVKITPKIGSHDGDPIEYDFSGRFLSAGGFLGSTPSESGVFRFPVFAESNSVKIELINDSPLPSNFQALTFEASYTSRSTPSGL